MDSTGKKVMAFASIIDPALCDGVIVKLISTQSTEQVRMCTSKPKLICLFSSEVVICIKEHTSNNDCNSMRDCFLHIFHICSRNVRHYYIIL